MWVRTTSRTGSRKPSTEAAAFSSTAKTLIPGFSLSLFHSVFAYTLAEPCWSSIFLEKPCKEQPTQTNPLILDNPLFLSSWLGRYAVSLGQDNGNPQQQLPTKGVHTGGQKGQALGPLLCLVIGRQSHSRNVLRHTSGGHKGWWGGDLELSTGFPWRS